MKIQQFINFNLSIGDRHLQYLYGLKIFVMSMCFLLIYNKRQTFNTARLSASTSRWGRLSHGCPCFSLIAQGCYGTVSHSCCSDVGLPCSGSRTPVGCYACQILLAATVFSPCVLALLSRKTASGRFETLCRCATCQPGMYLVSLLFLFSFLFCVCLPMPSVTRTTEVPAGMYCVCPRGCGQL